LLEILVQNQITAVIDLKESYNSILLFMPLSSFAQLTSFIGGSTPLTSIPDRKSVQEQRVCQLQGNGKAQSVFSAMKEQVEKLQPQIIASIPN
jgi:hypothetical protein